jgi:hypothetical protein
MYVAYYDALVESCRDGDYERAQDLAASVYKLEKIHPRPGVWYDAMRAAAARHDLKIIALLEHTYKYDWDAYKGLIRGACEGGYLDLIKYTHTVCDTYHADTCILYACIYDRLDIMHYALTLPHTPDLYDNNILLAMKYGSIHIFRYLYPKSDLYYKADLMLQIQMDACLGGHPEIITTIESILGAMPSIAKLCGACYRGSVDAVKTILSPKYPSDLTTSDLHTGLECAVEANRRDVVWIILEHGLPFDTMRYDAQKYILAQFPQYVQIDIPRDTRHIYYGVWYSDNYELIERVIRELDAHGMWKLVDLGMSVACDRGDIRALQLFLKYGYPRLQMSMDDLLKFALDASRPSVDVIATLYRLGARTRASNLYPYVHWLLDYGMTLAEFESVPDLHRRASGLATKQAKRIQCIDDTRYFPAVISALIASYVPHFD